MTITKEFKRELVRLGYVLASIAIGILQLIVFLYIFKYAYDVFLYDLTDIAITKVNIYGVFCLLLLVKLKRIRKSPASPVTIQALKKKIKLHMHKIFAFAIMWGVIQIILLFIK